MIFRDCPEGTEVLLSFDAKSRAEVDEIARKAAKAGGTVFGEPAERQGWMYGCGFADLDGHRWNVLYMDMSKMPKQQLRRCCAGLKKSRQKDEDTRGNFPSFILLSLFVPNEEKNNMAKKAASTDRVPAGNVDAYLASAPQALRKVLENLRQAIKAAAPKAEEIISYQIPTYKYHGPLVHFVARKDYCSFIVASRAVLESFKRELADYDTSGTTIHFTAENPLPAALVKKIVKARIAENEATAKLKQKTAK